MTDPGTGRGSVELPQRVDGGLSAIGSGTAAIGGKRSLGGTGFGFTPQDAARVLCG
jgi:hypothetical protein